MRNFQKVLVFKDICPRVPRHLLDFFREEEESFLSLFFYLFSFVTGPDDVKVLLNDALCEVDWVGHDLDDDLNTYEKALGEATQTFFEFFNRAEPQLGFLRNPPHGVVLADISVIEHDERSFLLNIEYSNVPVKSKLKAHDGEYRENNQNKLCDFTHSGIV